MTNFIKNPQSMLCKLTGILALTQCTYVYLIYMYIINLYVCTFTNTYRFKHK